METYSSFPIINRHQYFLFMTASAENPVSRNCVDTKGSKTFIASSHKLSLFSHTAKTEDVHLHQTCLSRNHHRICLNCS